MNSPSHEVPDASPRVPRTGVPWALACRGVLPWVALAGLAVSRPLPAQGSAGSLAARQETRGIARMTYVWTDVNTERIVAWRGDVRVVDPRTPARRFTVTLDVATDRLQQAIDAFGVSRDRMNFQYRGAVDSAQARTARDALLAAHGLSAFGGGRTVRVAFDWAVQPGQPDIAAAASVLQEVARHAGYTTRRQVVGLVASFVQSMAYRIPPSDRLTSRGERVTTGGVTLPIETLVNGWGDCDTKSMLFIALAANIPGVRVILMTGAEHALVGVQMDPVGDDAYVEYRGLPYVLTEMTTPWPLGSTSGVVWAQMERHAFKAYPFIWGL